MQPDLSVSIVDTNNREQTLDCLQSVFAATGGVILEVFVVDNACTDGSFDAIASRFPQVRIIRNRQMEGFSTNNNMVLSKATGRYLMLLNDDTIIQASALDNMVRFADAHPEIGVVGGNLLNLDGSVQQSYDRVPTPLYEAFRPLSSWLVPPPRQADEPLEVDNVCGACMLVRREVIRDVGLLDTAFDPLYGEEVEWCYRIQRAGWKILHLPQARVVHLGSQTMNRAPLYKLERLYEKKALFFRKHGGPLAVWSFRVGLLCSSVIKMIAWGLVHPVCRNASKVWVHWHIAKKSLRL